MILVGYASAMRRSEIVALTLADVEHAPASLLLHVRRSKTDQQGHGQVVAVAYGRHALTDPVAALLAWRAMRGEAPGALFTRIWARSVSLQPLSGHVVARMLRARAVAAGLDGTRITGHSMRAGNATTAALAGVPLDRIAAQTRHKDVSVLVNRHIRSFEALAWTPETTAPARWRHFDPDTFEIGRGRLDIGSGRTIALYSAERSIVDAFRMRHLEGADLANEALKRWLRRGGQPSELLALARSFPRILTALRETIGILL